MLDIVNSCYHLVMYLISSTVLFKRLHNWPTKLSLRVKGSDCWTNTGDHNHSHKVTGLNHRQEVEYLTYTQCTSIAYRHYSQSFHNTSEVTQCDLHNVISQPFLCFSDTTTSSFLPSAVYFITLWTRDDWRTPAHASWWVEEHGWMDRKKK